MSELMNGDVVRLVSRTGCPYEVVQGLPPSLEAGAGLIENYGPPYQPHVIAANAFVLRDTMTSRILVNQEANEKGLNVLYMHGRRIDGQWLPSNPELARAGVTIPDLIGDFEEVTHKHLDVLFVCSTRYVDAGETSRTRTVAPGLVPRVFMMSGSAQGYIRGVQGRVLVEMEVSSPNKVVYLPWLQYYGGRASQVRRIT